MKLDRSDQMQPERSDYDMTAINFVWSSFSKLFGCDAVPAHLRFQTLRQFRRIQCHLDSARKKLNIMTYVMVVLLNVPNRRHIKNIMEGRG